MKSVLPLFIAAMIMAFPFAAQADQILTQMQVKNFIASIKDVKELSNRQTKKGKTGYFKENVNVLNNGDFSPYSNAAALLKREFPDHYSSLERTVKGYGFSSAADWASTGDDIMAAFMSNHITQQTRKSLEKMEQMTPDQKAIMPPESLKALERTRALIEVSDAVPAENKALARQFNAQIKQAVNSMSR